MKKLFLAVVLAALASSAGAQDTPAVEFTAGYAFLQSGFLETSFPVGIMASVNVPVTRSLGIVGDISYNRKTEKDDIYNVEAKLTQLGAYGGLRWSGRNNPRVVPYVQGMAGIVRHGGSVSALDVSVGASDTDFSFQAGAGVIFKLTDLLGIDAGADYRYWAGNGESSNDFRFHAGLAFAVGD